MPPASCCPIITARDRTLQCSITCSALDSAFTNPGTKCKDGSRALCSQHLPLVCLSSAKTQYKCAPGFQYKWTPVSSPRLYVGNNLHLIFFKFPVSHDPSFGQGPAEGRAWSCVGLSALLFYTTRITGGGRTTESSLPKGKGDGLQSGGKRCMQWVWEAIFVAVSGAVWQRLRSVSQWECFLYVNCPLLYIFVINIVASAVTVCFLISFLFLVNSAQLSSGFLPFVSLMRWDGGKEEPLWGSISSSNHDAHLQVTSILKSLNSIYPGFASLFSLY